MTLDPETLRPSPSLAEGPPIHATLASIWSQIISQGLEKQIKADLFSRYLRILRAYREMSKQLQLSSGNKASSALTALGHVNNILFMEKQFPKKEKLLSLTGYIGKILPNIHHITSMYRSSAISPVISKQDRDAGFNDFGEKFKHMKEMKKSSKDLQTKTVLPSTSIFKTGGHSGSNQPQSSKFKPLNSRSPSRQWRESRQKGYPPNIQNRKRFL